MCRLCSVQIVRAVPGPASTVRSENVSTGALRAENIRRAELAGQFGSKVFGSAAVALGCRAR